jgi:hypothetical protein
MTILFGPGELYLRQRLEYGDLYLQHNCHPERSRGTSAVLILPVPLGAFQPRAPAPNEGLANKITDSQDDDFVEGVERL